MISRCWLLVFLLLLVQSSVHCANITCPYDLDSASGVVPPSCYANASFQATASSCCYYVFLAYVFAAISYANRTGTTFLPLPTASACTDAFSSVLLSGGLVEPTFFRDGNCSFVGDNFAAGQHPCLLPNVSAVRAIDDLSDVTRLCASPSVGDLSPDSAACPICQEALIATTLTLYNVTQSKDSIQCGMAVTISMWSPTPPPIARYRSYSLCCLGLGSGLTSGTLPPPSDSPGQPTAAVFTDPTLQLQVSVRFLPFE